MHPVVDAELGIFKPDNDSYQPDYVVPADDIEGVDYTARIQRRKDDAKITIHNNDGRYSENYGEAPITSGDRIEFRVAFPGDTSPFDAQTFGGGAFSGMRLRWTGWVRDIEYEFSSADDSAVVLSCEDYAFGVLGERTVYNSFRDAQIAGTDDAIVDTLLANNAPELRTDYVGDIDRSTSLTADGKNLLELMVSLTRQGDAVFRARRDAVIFHPVTAAPSDWGYGSGGYGGGGYGASARLDGDDLSSFSVTATDDGLANNIRVDGGTDTELDDEHTTQNGYETVARNDRLLFQVSTRKATLKELELHTNPTGTNESVTVRIQKDRNGAPVAVGDESSDIASKTLSYEFLANDGLTTFEIPDHTLPEPDPWVIIETDGEDGQAIGVDTGTTTTVDGTDHPVPRYKAHYEYPLTVVRPDYKSQQEYRQRDYRIKDDSISSLREAIAVAEEKLAHDATPNREIAAEALSRVAHRAALGSVYSMSFPRETVDGSYLVTERTESYDGGTLQTSLTLQEVETI